MVRNFIAFGMIPSRARNISRPALCLFTAWFRPFCRALIASLPKRDQRAGHSSDRITVRKRELLHSFGHFVSRGVSTNIPVLPWRIGPHHEEIRACRDAAMIGPSRQYRYVSRLHRNFGGTAFIHFIITIPRRMKSLGWPTIVPEQRLKIRSGRHAVLVGRDVTIQNDEEDRVVRHPIARGKNE